MLSVGGGARWSDVCRQPPMAPVHYLESGGAGVQTACVAFLIRGAWGLWFAARGEFPVEGAGCERDVVCTLPFFSVEFLGFLGRGDSVDDKPVHVPCLACEYFFHVVFIFAGSDGKQCEGQIEDELDSFHVCMCMISLNTVPSEQGVDGGCLSSETLVKCHGVFCAAA